MSEKPSSKIKLFFTENIALLILLVINLVLGAIYVTDYGLSWDEPSRFQVAEKSLATYMADTKEPSGRMYLAITELGTLAFKGIFKSWSFVNAWHYMNFIYFQLSLIFFYMICIRFFNRRVAFAITLLYATQPILVGHAFINPKDTPYTMYFLGSLGFGLKVGDFIHKNRLGPIPAHRRISAYRTKFTQKWNTIGQKQKTFIRRFAIISIALLVLLILVTPLVEWTVKTLIIQTSQGNAVSVINNWLNQIAENINQVPPELYAQKAIKIYFRVIFVCALIAAFINLIILGSSFSHTLGMIWRDEIIPVIKGAPHYLKDANVWAAGFCIGMATSIRILGPASWALLVGYLILKFGRKAFSPAISVAMVTLVTMFISWPGLWTSPTESLSTTAAKAVDFPWESTVMFGGIEYPASQLPASYMPVLISLQLTEPVLLLFLVSIILAVVKLKNRTVKWQMIVFFTAWFFIPFFGVIIFRPTMYDNFRHFLFILPALFLFCGISLTVIFNSINKKIIHVLLLIVCLFPAIYGIITLHPYQYIYYNRFTGGVRGAFRKYELDYWATSYQEAAQFVNQIAPPNAKVMVWGPLRLGKYYCRPDLELANSTESWDLSSDEPIYAIVSTRHNKDQTVFPDAPTLFWVERGGAQLVVVKQISP